MMYFWIAVPLCVLAVTMPVFWGTMAVYALAVLAAVRVRPVRDAAAAPTFRPLFLLLIGPVAIVVVGLWQANKLSSGATATAWQMVLVMGLVALEIGLAAWAARRMRANRALAIVIGALALWYTVGTMLVAGMSMTNTWL